MRRCLWAWKYINICLRFTHKYTYINIWLRVTRVVNSRAHLRRLLLQIFIQLLSVYVLFFLVASMPIYWTHSFIRVYNNQCIIQWDNKNKKNHNPASLNVSELTVTEMQRKIASDISDCLAKRIYSFFFVNPELILKSGSFESLYTHRAYLNYRQIYG